MSAKKIPEVLTSKVMIFKYSEYRTCFKKAIKGKYCGQRDNDVDNLFDNYPAWFHVKIMDRCDWHLNYKPEARFVPFILNLKTLATAKLCLIELAFLVDNNGDFIFIDEKHRYNVDKDTGEIIFDDGNDISYEDYEDRWSIELINEIDDDAFMYGVRCAIEHVERYINEVYGNNPLKRVLNVCIKDNATCQVFEKNSDCDILGCYDLETKEITLYRNTIFSCIKQLALENLMCQVISMVLVHEIEHAYQDLTLYESFHSLISLDKEDRAIKNAVECFAEGAAYRYLMHIHCLALADKWMDMRKQFPNSKYTALNGVPYWDMDQQSWRNYLHRFEDKYAPKAKFVYK